MLSSRRAADLLAMVLVAVPLFGCGDARNGGRSPAASGAMSQNSADASGDVQDMAPEDTAMMNRIARIEGRHFDLYRHYRMLASRQTHMADGADDEVDDDADGALRKAVMNFSATSLTQALSACSMRALMALD